jgi:hypothetical protein
MVEIPSSINTDVLTDGEDIMNAEYLFLTSHNTEWKSFTLLQEISVGTLQLPRSKNEDSKPL